jgi:predicted enzyme related to lactoylglutathione lyase
MSGQINWVEVPAASTAKARAFYGSLFGWGTSEFGGGDYHVIDNGPAGAIAPREDGFTHPRVYFADLQRAAPALGTRCVHRP